MQFWTIRSIVRLTPTYENWKGYCGWLYFRGYQFSWIEQKYSWGSKFVVIIFSFIIRKENYHFVGTGIRGLGPPRKPRKLVPQRNLSHSQYVKMLSFPHMKRKRKTSDSVLWQKPLHPQKNKKSNATTQEHHQRLWQLSDTTIANRLRTVSSRNESQPTGVV